MYQVWRDVKLFIFDENVQNIVDQEDSNGLWITNICFGISGTILILVQIPYFFHCHNFVQFEEMESITRFPKIKFITKISS